MNWQCPPAYVSNPCIAKNPVYSKSDHLPALYTSLLFASSRTCMVHSVLVSCVCSANVLEHIMLNDHCHVRGCGASRALRRHRQPQGMLMDSDQAPAVEELFLDLRRSDGQSDSSSSSSEAFVENRGTSPPRLSPPVSTQQSTDSECDSVDSSTCEKTLLLQTTRKTHMEIGTNDRDEPTASGHQVLCHQEWPLDLSQVDISTVPRGLPEGCSESSSSSDCSLLTDM